MVNLNQKGMLLEDQKVRGGMHQNIIVMQTKPRIHNYSNYAGTSPRRSSSI